MPVRLSPFEKALLLHERGESGAVDAYRAAIEAEDYVADAYCNLGILEHEAERVPRAFDCFTTALKHEPRHFETHFNLALAHEGRLEDAYAEMFNLRFQFSIGQMQNSARLGEMRKEIARLNTILRAKQMRRMQNQGAE